MNRNTSIAFRLSLLGGVAILFLTGIVLGGQVVAQDPPDDPPLPSAEDLENERESVAERIRVLRAWRLTEELDLDESTGVQLFASLDTYDEQLEEVQQQLEQSAQTLNQLLESGGTDEEISDAIESILTAHLSIEQARVDLIRNSGEYLDPTQQALLMLFLPEFDREIRNMIREVRQRREHGEDRPGHRNRHGMEPGGPEGGFPPPEGAFPPPDGLIPPPDSPIPPPEGAFPPPDGLIPPPDSPIPPPDSPIPPTNF